MKELEKAAEGESPDGVILDHLGDAYSKTQQFEQAISTWRRAAAAFKEQDDAKLLKKTEAKIKQHSTEN